MLWPLACLAIAAAGLVSWIVLRLLWYRSLFAAPHLMQFAQGLAAVKQAAMQDMVASDREDVLSPDDPRILRTSAGLALLYTVSPGAAGHTSIIHPSAFRGTRQRMRSARRLFYCGRGCSASNTGAWLSTCRR